MKQILSGFFSGPAFYQGTRLNSGLLILRLFAGLALCTVFEKFFPKNGIWGPQPWFIADVARMGFPFPVLFAWLAVLAEFFGGILLVLGLCTRTAALLNCLVTFTAAFIYHKAAISGSGLVAFSFMIICLSILLTGPGTYSFDYLLLRKKKVVAGILSVLLVMLLAVNPVAAKAELPWAAAVIASDQDPVDSTRIVFFLRHNRIFPKKYTLIIYNPLEQGNNTRVHWLLPFQSIRYRLPKGSKIYLASAGQIGEVMQGNRIDQDKPFLFVDESIEQKVVRLSRK